jgi:hypothetical protein
MSDNVRRFLAVRTALTQYYPHTDSKRHQRHLTTLAAMVAGIVAAGSSHLPKMAQKAPDQTKTESRVKRFSRFIQNERVTYEAFFMPFARDLVGSLSIKQPLLVVFDGSALGRGCAVLMASVIYGKRALPLCWLVKKGNKGSFSAEDHLCLLEQVRALIPQQTDVIFLGDGEFDSIALQRGLDEAGWSYVCRTASSTRVTDGTTDCAIGALMPLAGERYLSMPGASMTQARYGPVHVIVWHERPYREAVYLVTSLDLAEEALYWYRHRFGIETLFSDKKSRGFHLHKSHLSDPSRLSRLLLAAALAYLWMVYLGVEALRQGWYKQFHRSDRVDLSLFQLGLRLLEHMLNEAWAILVAFIPPPLDSMQSVR